MVRIEFKAEFARPKRRAIDYVRDALDRIDCGEARKCDWEFLVRINNKLRSCNKLTLEQKRIREMIEPYLTKYDVPRDDVIYPWDDKNDNTYK